MSSHTSGRRSCSRGSRGLVLFLCMLVVPTGQSYHLKFGYGVVIFYSTAAAPTLAAPLQAGARQRVAVASAVAADAASGVASLVTSLEVISIVEAKHSVEKLVVWLWPSTLSRSWSCTSSGTHPGRGLPAACSAASPRALWRRCALCGLVLTRNILILVIDYIQPRYLRFRGCRLPCLQHALGDAPGGHLDFAHVVCSPKADVVIYFRLVISTDLGGDAAVAAFHSRLARAPRTLSSCCSRSVSESPPSAARAGRQGPSPSRPLRHSPPLVQAVPGCRACGGSQAARKRRGWAAALRQRRCTAYSASSSARAEPGVLVLRQCDGAAVVSSSALATARLTVDGPLRGYLPNLAAGPPADRFP